MPPRRLSGTLTRCRWSARSRAACCGSPLRLRASCTSSATCRYRWTTESCSTRIGTRHRERAARRPCSSARRTGAPGRSAFCTAGCSPSAASRSSSRASAGRSARAGGSIPFDERADGLATLRWLREQPWHDGPVGTIGPSYMGIVQWAVADQVDAMAPSVSASQFQGRRAGGSISLDTALSWLVLFGPGAAPRRRCCWRRAAPHAARRCTSTCRSASSTARLRRAGRVVPRVAREPVAGQPVLGRARLLIVGRRRHRRRSISSAAGTTSSCRG